MTTTVYIVADKYLIQIKVLKNSQITQTVAKGFGNVYICVINTKIQPHFGHHRTSSSDNFWLRHDTTNMYVITLPRDNTNLLPYTEHWN